MTKKLLIIFAFSVCLFIPLKIQATGNLQLTSPNGNEEWKIEQNYEIRWQADPIIEKVSLVLYRDRQLIGIIARNIPASDTKITWAPGFEITENNNYRIGVYEYPFSQGKPIDYSDAPFTVKKDSLSAIIETNFHLGVNSNHILPESVLYFNPEKNSGWFYIAQTIPENNLSFWAAAVRSLSTQPDDNTAQLIYGITNTSTGEYYSGVIENGLFSESADKISLYFQKDGHNLLEFQQTKNDWSEFELKTYLPWPIGSQNVFQLDKTLAFQKPILFESGDGIIPMAPGLDSLYVSLALDQGFWVDFQKFNLDPSQIFFRPANHRWMSFILDKEIGSLKAGTIGVGWEILDENNQRQPGGYTNIDLLIPGNPQMTAIQEQIDKMEVIELEYWSSPYKKYLKKWKIIYPGMELLFETLIPNQESGQGPFRFYEGMIKVLNPQTGEQVGTGMIEATHDETETVATDKFFTYQFASDTVDVTVGMKKQYRNGVYDGTSNTTYIVYPSGIYGQYSACNPYIRSYNHKTRTWSNEVLVDNSFEWQHDNHNYPQILIDNNGYIHIFSFGHGTQIVHATSVNPRDISSWSKETLRPSDIQNATYPAAYKAKNGDFYVLFRQGLLGLPDGWHEPETILKSTDNGKTWTMQRIIDPFHNPDGWNTIYIKGLYYSPDPEGIHITFGIHKNHNEYFNKHYYVFYSFSDNHIYSPSGVDFGTTIDRNEMESCPECLILDYGHDMHYDSFGSQPMAISIDKNNSPQIYYTYLTGFYRGILHIKKWDKNTKNWQDTAYPELEDTIGVNNTEYNSAKDTTDLYIRLWEGTLAPTYLYSFDGSTFTQIQLIYNTTSKIHFNSDYHPEIKFVFGNDSYHGWNTPLPIGSRIAAGERDFSQANSCSISQYYTNMVGSGNPYFQYPIAQPCTEYSIGSSLQSNGEFYSTLIPVQPNTTYKVSYSVKTKELTSIGAQYPGSVIVSEYNSSANRIHDGRRNNVPTVTGTTDWTSKNYTFTTTASTAYVKIRLINAGWGEAKGRVWFKDTALEINN